MESEITLQITFNEYDIESIRSKFDIDNKEDLYQAVWEMISTYLEM